MSLHAKIAAVMAEADRIPKNGTAPAQMGGYKFVQVGDAADAIRTALGSRGVSMLPTAVEIVAEAEHETSKGGTMTTLTVRTTWTLTDSETNESAVIQSLGTGADTGDKASPKAQTNAMKYALLMGFLLSTGDDPEASTLEERGQRRAAPVGRAPAVADGATVTIVGTVSKAGNKLDLALRQTPDGMVCGFKLVDVQGHPGGKDSIGVRAFGPAAEAVGEAAGRIEGQRLALSGTLRGESFDKVENGQTKTIRYQVLHLATADGPGLTYPPDVEPAAPASTSDGKVENLDDLPF